MRVWIRIYHFTLMRIQIRIQASRINTDPYMVTFHILLFFQLIRSPEYLSRYEVFLKKVRKQFYLRLGPALHSQCESARGTPNQCLPPGSGSESPVVSYIVICPHYSVSNVSQSFFSHYGMVSARAQ